MGFIIDVFQIFIISMLFLFSGGLYFKEYLKLWYNEIEYFLKIGIGVLAIIGTAYTVKDVYNVFLSFYISIGGGVAVTNFIGDKNKCGKLSYNNGDYFVGFYKKGKRNGSGFSYYSSYDSYLYRYYKYDSFWRPEVIIGHP